MKKYFAVLIILFVAFSSCKPDPNLNPTTKEADFKLHHSIKDLLSVKEGSYYVYQDSATGLMDTFFHSSTQTSNEVYLTEVADEKFGEAISYAIESKSGDRISIGAQANQYTDAVVLTSINGKRMGLYDQSLQINQSIKPIYLIWPEYWLRSAQFSAYYDSLVLQGNKYYQVYEYASLTDTCASCPSLFEGTTLFTPQDGPIRISYSGPNGAKALELLDYVRVPN